MSQLRYGYSTGACATALAVAAWLRLTGDLQSGQAGQIERPEQAVPVRFGDGVTRSLPVTVRETDPRFVRIIKDAGDDPDCTHRAVLFGRLLPLDDAAPEPHDVALRVGEGRVILRAVEGIGICTRPGLDCEPGTWAINIAPRRMIAEHLLAAGLTSGHWLFELGIENGVQLATKTLNARLGVVGGLSVLGTTGLVRPYSHDAWIATVRLCARSIAAEGGNTLVLCTGGRTTRGAQALLNLPKDTFVSMGDFLEESLKAAAANAMRQVIVACMPGKLCKYAAGHANTHAHRVPQDMDLFCRVLSDVVAEGTPENIALFTNNELLAKITQAASVREALLSLLPDQIHGLRDAVLARLTSMALHHFRTVAPEQQYRVLVFDFEGCLLLDSQNLQGDAHA